MSNYNVNIWQEAGVQYPLKPPYNPPFIYPEFKKFNQAASIDKSNRVYSAIRNSLVNSKLDTGNIETGKWNPFGGLITPGQIVFLKPNMIAEKHKNNDDWDYVITHGSVIRCVLDYCFLALEGKGRVIIGDAPQTDSDFDKIVGLMGLKEIQDVYSNYTDFTIEIINLQDEHWIEKDGVYIETVKLPGDPRGSIKVDLGKASMFTELDGKGKKYYGAFYDVDETNAHHNDQNHDYAIARSPVIADVLINLPKLKTHKKCGLTVNLKGLVGINANKNWLPHYIFGSPESGGDQFPVQNKKSIIENSIVLTAKKILLNKNSIVQYLARRLKKVAYSIFGSNENTVRSGNWYGNDTAWRMSVDLNRILIYANDDGTMKTSGVPKKVFSVVDGIYAMEGNGPVAGTKKETGIIIMGDNPVAVDAVCAKVMGFDYQKLPIICRSIEPHEYPMFKGSWDEIKVISNEKKFNKSLKDINFGDSFKFKPHFAWVGHIEDH